ncbi:Protein SULFUR DEFICIENCY-INDUCED 2 [Ananas comosus]|uniref:Protein SULFUR DEFICIENCY-INDUCED 2 n=1 Tax=Ananas comosus TaxID=4615 RepID=A0A199VUD1_ANACO|nr:Protein SULFUR DEFICIENCY-INDUCED 2 [Ananas comosus]
MVERGGGGARGEGEHFRVIHKIPSGDGPYVRAKHLQLVEKDLDAAIVWFWKAINAGDRVESALKDMAVVMKQQDRAEEAVEAIKSFRHLCSKQAQESLDNLLIDLYKKCGMAREEIELLKQKLRKIFIGEAFNGKVTKKARCHGKKVQVSIQQETSRLLGNLAWAYMQQRNYMAAEVVYRKAQMIDADANKACNLAHCLIEQGRFVEAKQILNDVLNGSYCSFDSGKIAKRAEELLSRISLPPELVLWDMEEKGGDNAVTKRKLEEEMMEMLDTVIKQWAPFRSKRLPIFEEIFPYRDQMAC